MPASDPASLEIVGRDELEARIEDVRRSVARPANGVFGPDSKLWEVNRHTIMFLAGGNALLLQAAHPFVAHGVDQHSVSVTDPIGRFNRTFAAVFAMVYGDLDTAVSAARRTHAIHSGIPGEIGESVGAFQTGHPYHANHPEALLWVHSTLWDSSVRIFEAFVRTLSLQEKEQYYDETRRFAWLFGIPDRVLPARWDDFVAYNERMWQSTTLAVGEPATLVCRSLFDPRLHPRRPGLRPLLRWYQGMVAGQLPPGLRGQYGLHHDPRRYQRWVRRLRFLESRLPRRLRFLPAYIAALRRLEGRRERDPLGELLGRAFVGSSRR